MNEDIITDLKTLNILVNSPKDLGNFTATVGENVFEQQYRRFVKNLTNYYNVYKSCPTYETLVEFCAKNNNNLQEYLVDVWDQLEEHKTDPREFNFLLAKINKRYNIKAVKHINELTKDVSENNIDSINESLHKMSAEIKNIGSKKAYKEVLIRNYVEEWKQQFFARTKNKELAQGVMTGFSMLDYYTNGLRPSEFMLIAGDTGGGKSVMLLNLAVNMFMGKNKIPETFDELVEFNENKGWEKAYNVLFITLEMPASEILDRIISIMSSVNNLNISKGNIKQTEAVNIKKALYYWENSPYNIKVVDMPRGASVSAIQQIYEETCLDFKPDVVIIDYLGQMIDNDANSESDWLKLMKIAEEIHEMGRVCECVMISAVQVTQMAPGAGGIGLHRIGRSRMIAHNANLVLQIENREDEDARHDARIHNIKFRRGPKFIMSNLVKEFKFTRFADLGFCEKDDDGNDCVDTNRDDLTDIIKEIFGDEEF